MRLMITGAAPISPTVLTFLRAALGCQVTHAHTHFNILFHLSPSIVTILCFLSQFYEGYGQTECTAGCTMTMSGDWTAGNK